MSGPKYWTAILLLLLVILQSAGCVRRRLTVRSEPPGALVYIDGQEIGRTPVATPFTYYGTRNIRLVKDGFETISVNQRFAAPWYQVPPLDFASENLVTHEIRDERVAHFELVPKANVSAQDVLIQADQLRSMARPGVTTGQPPQQRPPQQRCRHLASPPQQLWLRPGSHLRRPLLRPRVRPGLRLRTETCRAGVSWTLRFMAWRPAARSVLLSA